MSDPSQVPELAHEGVGVGGQGDHQLDLVTVGPLPPQAGHCKRGSSFTWILYHLSPSLFYGMFDLARKFEIPILILIVCLLLPASRPPAPARLSGCWWMLTQLALRSSAASASTSLHHSMRTPGGHEDTYMTSEWLLVIIRHRDLVRDNSARRSAEIVQ